MAGFISPSINVAKGADKGRLFTGTGPDTATWSELPVSPQGGSFGAPADRDAALSALLDGLRKLGVDTSQVKSWAKGLELGGGLAAGWWIQYGSSLDGSNFGTLKPTNWYPLPRPIGYDETLWDPAAPAMWDPAGLGGDRYLILSGAAFLGRFFKIHYYLGGEGYSGSSFSSYGSLVYTALSTVSGGTGRYRRTTIHTKSDLSDAPADWDIQP